MNRPPTFINNPDADQHSITTISGQHWRRNPHAETQTLTAFGIPYEIKEYQERHQGCTGYMATKVEIGEPLVDITPAPKALDKVIDLIISDAASIVGHKNVGEEIIQELKELKEGQAMVNQLPAITKQLFA